MYNHIVKRSYSKIFRELDKPSINSISDIGREFNMDSARVCRLVNDWVGQRLLNKKRTNGSFKITLTDNGKELKKLLVDLHNLHKKINKEVKNE